MPTDDDNRTGAGDAHSRNRAIRLVSALQASEECAGLAELPPGPEEERLVRAIARGCSRAVAACPARPGRRGRRSTGVTAGCG